MLQKVNVNEGHVLLKTLYFWGFFKNVNWTSLQSKRCLKIGNYVLIQLTRTLQACQKCRFCIKFGWIWWSIFKFSIFDKLINTVRYFHLSQNQFSMLMDKFYSPLSLANVIFIFLLSSKTWTLNWVLISGKLIKTSGSGLGWPMILSRSPSMTKTTWSCPNARCNSLDWILFSVNFPLTIWLRRIADNKPFSNIFSFIQFCFGPKLWSWSGFCPVMWGRRVYTWLVSGHYWWGLGCHATLICLKPTSEPQLPVQGRNITTPVQENSSQTRKSRVEGVSHFSLE